MLRERLSPWWSGLRSVYSRRELSRAYYRVTGGLASAVKPEQPSNSTSGPSSTIDLAWALSGLADGMSSMGGWREDPAHCYQRCQQCQEGLGYLCVPDGTGRGLQDLAAGRWRSSRRSGRCSGREQPPPSWYCTVPIPRLGVSLVVRVTGPGSRYCTPVPTGLRANGKSGENPVQGTRRSSKSAFYWPWSAVNAGQTLGRHGKIG